MKYIVPIILFLTSCQPKTESPNRFGDESLLHIYDLQDKRDTEALLPYLKAKKEEHRITAALAFASIQDSLSIPYLNQMLQIDQDHKARKAAAYALGQIRSPKAIGILKSAFDNELYNGNRPTILEAIGKCGDSTTIDLFEKVSYQDQLLQLGWAYGVLRLEQKGYSSENLKKQMTQYLASENKEIALIASHYLYRSLRRSSGPFNMDSLAQLSKFDEVKERLMLLEQEEVIQEQLNWDWTVEFNKLNPYQKSEKLLRLDHSNPKLIEFCLYILKDSSAAKILKTTAMQKYIDARKAISLSMWPSPTIEDGIELGLKSGDMSLQSIAAIELQNQEYLQQSKKWMPLLEDAKSQLSLPQQSETFIDISKAIESLGGEPYAPFKPLFNNPIDWDFVKTIPHNQQVTVETNKGNITLQLLVNDAPGTTGNFLKLVDSGFYDGKYYHRVVPQFVIQGGCPRGDGWGSLDWSQRSEFSNYQRYKPGTVGIASSGVDTEGVQFFITHCSTPHLDGRYTIFARVIDGMSIVDKITVGDQIIRIKRATEHIDVDPEC